jgi:putative spermidine/putrescine transport system ATP-binding protein
MSAVIKDTAQQNDKPLVSLRNLNKYYGDFAAVDDISLDIKDGEFLTFLGSSGS